MQVGINYPFPLDQYGNYFGCDDVLGRWFEFLPQNLMVLKDTGVTFVRFFLLCNGNNYGMVAPLSRLTWVQKGETGAPPCVLPQHDCWAFEPPETPSKRYGDQLLRILSSFKAAQMKVIPSFVDFLFFAQPRRRGHLLGGGTGRYDAINDPKKRHRLLDFLDYLLDQSTAYRDVIFAWEVINEPSWLLRSIAPPLQDPIFPSFRRYLPFSRRHVAPDALRTFISDACALIEARGFESTVGHAFLEDFDLFPQGLGTKPQFHYYGALGSPLGVLGARSLPKHSKVQRKVDDTFIGEIGITAGRRWPGGKDCNGSTPGERAYKRLNHVAALGYELCLLWWELCYADQVPIPTCNPPDPLRFTESGLEGIRRFTRED